MGAMWTPLAQSTFRLSVTVSSRVKDRLEHLMLATRARRVTDLVAAALATYEMVVSERAKGASIVVRRPQPDGSHYDVLLVEEAP